MKTKQTAVDWLKQELDRQCMIKVFAWEDEAYFRKLLEQAKQMEKEQALDLMSNACMFFAASFHDHDLKIMTYENVYDKYYNGK
jgi:hypothetical protein